MARSMASIRAFRISISSISSGPTAATAQAKAFAMISSYRASRRLAVSFLESSRPGNDVSRGSTTAAAYTGPARGPAPASSQPQIH